MNPNKPDEATESYQLLMVLPRKKMALLEERCRLPQIEIPLHTRPAEKITSAIFERWGLPTVVIDWLPRTQGTPSCAVLEVLSREVPPCAELCPVSLSQIPKDAMPPETQAAVDRMLNSPPDRSLPFSSFGWVDEVKDWIRSCAEHQAICFTDVRQFNAGGSFALARFGTTSDGLTFWLKAVGAPNTNEFATTSYLVKHCSEYLPRIICMRGDWNAWVMQEFGKSLHHSQSLRDFELATTRLAGLQRALVGKTEELIAAQFMDHRMHVLASHIDELIDYLEEAMGRQTSKTVPAMSAHRLREIGNLLHESCDTMENLGIPDSVMHGDMSPGSILGDGERGCVLIDWCEAYVGNPFITFEQLCVHAVRKADSPSAWRQSLADSYRTCWREVLTEKQIDRALELTSLICVLSYLYGRGDWLHSSRRNEPEFQSYMRSLARHMDRIAGRSNQPEVVCQHN